MTNPDGRVAEWFKAPVLKTGVPARVPWVRIPPLPPEVIENNTVFVTLGFCAQSSAQSFSDGDLVLFEVPRWLGWLLRPAVFVASNSATLGGMTDQKITFGEMR